MTNRELLELAAKAAGLKIGFDGAGNAVLDWHQWVTWNPLTRDDDALRLAVKLKMQVWHTQVAVYTDHEILPEDFSPCREDARTDRLLATRRAIVRVAAEIGRMM